MAIWDHARPLPPEVLAAIHGHPVIGEAIVHRAGIDGVVALAVRSHHERLDGSGYPDGLMGPAIPALARLVAVCDAYDVLVTGRHYRDAVGPEEAVAALRQEKKAFDERFVGGLET